MVVSMWVSHLLCAVILPREGGLPDLLHPCSRPARQCFTPHFTDGKLAGWAWRSPRVSQLVSGGVGTGTQARLAQTALESPRGQGRL